MFTNPKLLIVAVLITAQLAFLYLVGSLNSHLGALRNAGDLRVSRTIGNASGDGPHRMTFGERLKHAAQAIHLIKADKPERDILVVTMTTHFFQDYSGYTQCTRDDGRPLKCKYAQAGPKDAVYKLADGLW